MPEEIKSAFKVPVKKEVNVLRKPKEPLGVIVITEKYRIIGDVHLTENTRLSDMLNVDTSKKDFIPMTNVKVYSTSDDKLLFTKDFLLINRRYIITIYVEESSYKQIKELVSLASSLIAQKQFDDAIIEAKRAIKLNNSDPEAHFVLGIAYAKKNLLTEAYEEFKLASAFAPKNSEIEQRALEMMSKINI